jgi:transcriptional regulator with XRE-family HTH domain
MQIVNGLSDKAILAEIGQRLARSRLNVNWTQDELARESGISRATLQRIEGGESAQLTQYIRLLRALNLMNNLDSMVPEPLDSPIQQSILSGKTRERAFKPRKKTTTKIDKKKWVWGDEV